jgi:tetratricopeptide (TPR) repeat protein
MVQRIFVFAVVFAAFSSSSFAGDLDRANSLYVLDDFDKALQVYQGIASGTGDDAVIGAFLVGKCYTRLGQHERAAQAYQQVLNQFPATVWAAHAGIALGDAFGALGEWEQAITAYRRVAEAYRGSSESVQAHLKMASVFANPFNESNNDYDEAISNYQYVLHNRADAVNAEIDFGQVYYGMGEAFRNLKRYEDAIAYFQKSRSEDPDGIWGAAAQNMIGNCRVAMRQPAAAVEAYRNTATSFRQQQAFVRTANNQIDALQRQGIQVYSDRAPVRIERGRFVRALVGSVTVTAPDWAVQCDEAEWDPESRMLTCSGNVTFFYLGGDPLFTATELWFRVPPETTITLPTPPAPPGIRDNIEANEQGQFPAMQTQ